MKLSSVGGTVKNHVTTSAWSCVSQLLLFTHGRATRHNRGNNVEGVLCREKFSSPRGDRLTLEAQTSRFCGISVPVASSSTIMTV